MGIILLPIIFSLIWWCAYSYYRLITLGMQEQSIAIPVMGTVWASVLIAPAGIWYFGFSPGNFWMGVAVLPLSYAIFFTLIKIGGSPLHFATSYAGGALMPIFAGAAWVYSVNQPGFRPY